jgi:hypothetical protein
VKHWRERLFNGVFIALLVLLVVLILVCPRVPYWYPCGFNLARGRFWCEVSSSRSLSFTWLSGGIETLDLLHAIMVQFPTW